MNHTMMNQTFDNNDNFSESPAPEVNNGGGPGHSGLSEKLTETIKALNVFNVVEEADETQREEGTEPKEQIGSMDVDSAPEGESNLAANDGARGKRFKPTLTIDTERKASKYVALPKPLFDDKTAWSSHRKRLQNHFDRHQLDRKQRVQAILDSLEPDIRIQAEFLNCDSASSLLNELGKMYADLGQATTSQNWEAKFANLQQKPNEPLNQFLARVLFEYNSTRETGTFHQYKNEIERAAYMAMRYRCLPKWKQHLLKIDEKIEAGEKKPSQLGPDGKADLFRSVNKDLMTLHRKSQVGQKTNQEWCRFNPCTRENCPYLHKEQKRRSNEEENLKSKKPKLACEHCGKKHRSDDCWTKFPHKAPNRRT